MVKRDRTVSDIVSHTVKLLLRYTVILEPVYIIMSILDMAVRMN